MPKLATAAKSEISKTLTTDQSAMREKRDLSCVCAVAGSRGNEKNKLSHATAPRILTMLMALR